MNIIADSLSVKQFDVINGMTVNGLDVKNYIQEQVEDQIQIDTELSNYAKTSSLSDYAYISALTAYAEKTMLSDYAQLSDITDSGEGLTPEQAADIENLKKDVQYLSTLSTEYQLTAAAGSMAYEEKGSYLTAIPEGYVTESEMTAYVNDHLTGSAEIDLTEYAKKTELSDIPSMKANIEYLGDLSSSYKLSAEAGSLAYMDLEDIEIPTDSTGLSATTKDLSIALGLNYKSYESTSANSLTSNAGAYSGFQLKLSAFSDAKICSFDFYRPSGTYGAATGTKLSVVGSSSSTFAGVNADNTYIVSDGTATYPAENTPYTAKMKYTDKAIPLDLSTLFFYFVNSATNAQVNVRFNVYGNYTTGTVASFLHGQSGWFVQLTANTVTTSLAGYVTPSQMESYVASHGSSSEEVDPKFAAISSEFLTNSALVGYAKTTELSDIPSMKASIQHLGTLSSNYKLSAEAGSLAYMDLDSLNFLKTSGGTLTGDIDLYESQLSVDSFNQIIDVSERKSLQAALNEKQDSLLKEPTPIVGPADRVIASSQFHAGVSLSTALVESGSTYKLYYPVLSADATIATTSDLASYITQDDLTGQSEAKVFYDLAEAVPSSNEIHLSANAINIFAPTAGDAGTTLSVYMPSQIDGHSRDCLLRLDQTSVATSLSVVFVGGSFESEDGEFPVPEASAVNIFSFVETAPNVFDISHKTVKGIN